MNSFPCSPLRLCASAFHFLFLPSESQTTINLTQRVAQERKNTLEQFLAEEQRLTGVLTDLRQTIEAGNELTLSVDALAKRLDLGGPKEGEAVSQTPAGAAPFEIEDYRVVVVEAGAAIRDLNNVVGSIHGLVDSNGAERLLPQVSSAIEEAGRLGDAIIDRAFYRALLFCVVALVGYIAARLPYRWFEGRFFGTPP